MPIGSNRKAEEQRMKQEETRNKLGAEKSKLREKRNRRNVQLKRKEIKEKIGAEAKEKLQRGEKVNWEEFQFMLGDEDEDDKETQA